MLVFKDGMIYFEETGETVATVREDHQEIGDTLAAAPELLKACRAIVRLGDWTGPTPDGFTQAWESAVAAIAKARG